MIFGHNTVQIYHNTATMSEISRDAFFVLGWAKLFSKVSITDEIFAHLWSISSSLTGDGGLLCLEPLNDIIIIHGCLVYCRYIDKSSFLLQLSSLFIPLVANHHHHGHSYDDVEQAHNATDREVERRQEETKPRGGVASGRLHGGGRGRAQVARDHLQHHQHCSWCPQKSPSSWSNIDF